MTMGVLSLDRDRDHESAMTGPAVHSAIFLLSVLLAAALMMFGPQALNDGDTLWHVTAGQWMLDHRQVVRTDPFSYSFAGKPWHAHEWLPEIAMALSYRAAGWAGVMVLGAAAFASTSGLLARLLLKRLEPVAALVALVSAAGCLALGLVLRPHLMVLPLLVLWTTALVKAREEGRAPHPAFALVLTVWANSHASFLFGLALTGPFALEALIEAHRSPWPVIRSWGLFGVAALVCALITPFGVNGLIFPLTTANMASLNSIVEWRPLDITVPQPVEFAAAAAIYVLVFKRVRLTVVRLGLLAGLSWMTMQHQRHQMLLAVVGVIVIAQAGRRGYAEPRIPSMALPAALISFAALAVVRIAAPPVLVDHPTLPIGAFAAIPADLRRQPVLNDYGMGGYLIFEGVRPFIDGRTDMYGDAFNALYNRAVSDKGALEGVLDRYRIGWTLFDPASRAAGLMDGEAGWRRLYTGPFAVVHVRRN